MRRLIALSAFFAFATAASAAPPPSTCGPWISQTNGIRWRMCADANGLVFCQLKAGGKVSAVVCPTG